MRTGRPCGPINETHVHYLKILAAGERWYEIGNSVLNTLVSRGLIERQKIVGTRRLFRITEAGRRALEYGGRGDD